MAAQLSNPPPGSLAPAYTPAIGECQGARRALAWGLAGFALGVALQGLVPDRPPTSAGWRLGLALLPLHLVATGAAAASLLWERPRRHWLACCGFGGLSRRVLCQAFVGLLWGLPLVYLLHAGGARLCRLFGLDAELPGTFGMLAEMASSGARAAAVLVLVLWVPVAEELLFRLVLTDAIRQAGLQHAGLWAASVFAAAHGSVAQAPALLVLGLILQRLRCAPGGLWAPVIAHSAFNGLALLGWLLLGRPG